MPGSHFSGQQSPYDRPSARRGFELPDKPASFWVGVVALAVAVAATLLDGLFPDTTVFESILTLAVAVLLFLGILRLVKKGKQKPKKKRKLPPSRSPILTPEQVYAEWARPEVFTVEGPETEDVYTYKPSILKDVRVGAQFFVEFIPGDACLVGENGSVWDSAENGGVPVAFRGSIFGFASWKAEKLVRGLQAQGKAVRGLATIRGWNREEGFPYVSVAVPDADTRGDFNGAVSIFGANSAWVGCKVTRINVPEDTFIPEGVVDTATARMAEPVGKRKPEVIFSIGRSAESFRLGARSSSYAFACELASSGKPFVCKYVVKEYDDGNESRRLYILT